MRNVNDFCKFQFPIDAYRWRYRGLASQCGGQEVRNGPSFELGVVST
jgi:hypothetical protein